MLGLLVSGVFFALIVLIAATAGLSLLFFPDLGLGLKPGWHWRVDYHNATPEERQAMLEEQERLRADSGARRKYRPARRFSGVVLIGMAVLLILTFRNIMGLGIIQFILIAWGSLQGR